MTPYERELIKQYAVAQALMEQEQRATDRLLLATQTVSAFMDDLFGTHWQLCAQAAEIPMQDWPLTEWDRLFLRVNRIQAD